MIGRVFVTGLLLSPLPAIAQTDTGTRLGGHPAQAPVRGTMSNVSRARIMLQGYAACVAKRDPKRVQRVLDAPLDGTEVSLRDLSQGNFDACLSGGGEDEELRMSPALLRGGLYVDRVSRSVRELTPALVALHPVAVPAGMAGTAHGVMVRFGDCVVRENPAAALDYVRAGATLGMEDKALESLKPALSACISSGDKVGMTRSSIKAAVGEAIYRIVHAPVVMKTDGK